VDGITSLQESKTVEIGQNIYQSLNSVWAGEALLLADRIDDARSLATEALALTRELNQRAGEAWTLRLVCEIASHGKAPDAATAEASYRQALTLADDLGMRPLVAHCHFGLAKLHGRSDRREQAAEHLDTATSMFRDMGMLYWLEQAESKALG